ncbi:MAG: hypothetical protein K2W95_16075 [Candidatus Obscuribacterales bacterium]|nr:hypothetical protein [Candidatus Obscuribacterales bacterium]
MPKPTVSAPPVQEQRLATQTVKLFSVAKIASLQFAQRRKGMPGMKPS